MTIEQANKTEKAILVIREQLENVIIPEEEILDETNYEMQYIFNNLSNLKQNIYDLERMFGSIEQYGIADELANIINGENY